MSTALRELFASFWVDFDKAGAIKKGDAQVTGLGHHLVELGKTVAAAFAVHEIVHFTKELIDAADETREAAEAVGTSAQQLQELEYAFSTAGVGAEDLRSVLAKFNKELAGTAEGKGATEALKTLGIDLKALRAQGTSSGDILELVGTRIGAIEDPIERAGIASQFFGKNYAKVLPLFAEGAEGIAKLKQEANDLGGVFSEEFLDNADEFNDGVTALKFGLRGLAIQAIGPLLPGMKAFTKDAVEVVKRIVAWAKHSTLLHNAGAKLKALLIGGLVRGIPLLVTKLGGLGGALVRLRTLALRTVLPFLALEDLIVFLAGGKSLLGEGLEAAFGKDTTEGIRKALLDLPKDVGHALDTMEDGFRLFIAFVMDAFDGLWNFISAGWRGTGKILGALGFEQAQKRIEESNFAAQRGGGRVQAEQDREAIRNIKRMHEEAEKKQGKTLPLEDFIPQGHFDDDKLKRIRSGLGLGADREQQNQQNVQDWRAAIAEEEKKRGKRVDPSAFVAQFAPKGTPAADLDRLIKELGPRQDPREAIREMLGPLPGQAQGQRFYIDDATAQQLGATFAQSTAEVLGSNTALMSVNQPQPVQQDINVRQSVQNSFVIPEGTPEEQQRAVASAASKGSQLDPNKIRAAFVPTPG